MIIDDIINSKPVESLGEPFARLFEYVRVHDLSNVPAGRIELDGDDLYINIEDACLCCPDDRPLEIHKHYIDVHFPISDTELIGWTPSVDLLEEKADDYDEQRDVRFYHQPASMYFAARPGQFYIMFTTDAHAPIIGDGVMRKAVAKIRID